MNTRMHAGYPHPVRGCQCDDCCKNRDEWQAHFEEGDQEQDEYAKATGGRSLFFDRLAGDTTS